MTAHARYSPSAAYRRLACPPSLVLEEQFAEEGESVFAAEGTAGHKLAEHLIRKHLGIPGKRPVSDYYSDELLEAVDDYVAFATTEIEDAKRSCASSLVLVEQRVDVSDYVAECFGTADLVIITDHDLHVIDLKLGKGIEVSATENPQLMIYGLGLLSMAELLYDIKTVRMTVFQPRLSNVSTYTLSPEALRQWGNEVLKPRGAMALLGAGEFAAGSWCRFCKARKQCRARAEEFLSLTRMDFRAPALLSDEEVAQVLCKADELSRWAQDIYSFAQDEAIIHGKAWPGFKLVEGRSNRKYTSEEEVEQTAKAAGYSEIYKHSLLGISDMEKLMGKTNFQDILGALVYKPQGKITLVPETDKREPINITTAQAEFMEESK